MAARKGTDSETEDGGWVLIEADCSEVDSADETSENASNVSDLVDNASIAETQGLSLQLFQQQELTECEEQLQQLKRKFVQSPQSRDLCSLSPQLASISLTPRTSKKVKKQLFATDSGIQSSNEADDSLEGQRQVEPLPGREENGADALFKVRDKRAFLYSKFKSSFGISFTDLTRVYNSDKTCSSDWVVCLYHVSDDRREAGKTLLQDHCEYFFLHSMGFCTLLLLCLFVPKCRNTLFKLCRSLFHISNVQMLADPPKTRSPAVALYWYKKGFASGTFTHGELPSWIAQQTLITHHLAAEKTFDLSEMVQWAYDNNLKDESEIAYKYAALAETDENALAFLKSNNQPKHVKDCATMCRYYKKAEMKRLSMSQWIDERCKATDDGPGDWKEVVKFLRHQGIEFILFLADFKKFLRGRPKKNCLVFWGPPNTGKSMFCMSLLSFLHGVVISYVNSKSHFWLQPLTEGKMGLLDDATRPCWLYIDTYLRNALDGNTFSVDCKHKAPLQLKCPPLLITTNVNVCGDEKFKYLRSRCSFFHFPHEFPLDDNGNPGFQLNDQSWASFFKRFWKHLDLSDPEDGEDGETQRGLRLTARGTTESV
uniref:Replication protein E1 n=1 Tax=Canine oral papillomavirus TaxID=35258 RepID=A0A2P1EPV8_COPV|nr:early protein 1 [Lambdapapillomavirus 2]AVM18353.1 early protein 1 [Lambdapapillomavirus 2]